MVHAIMRGCAERQRREHNNRAWHVWHTAVLPQQKRIPHLKSLMIPEHTKRAQTWQDQMHVARMITLAYGGTA
jgi:hypothetical protein